MSIEIDCILTEITNEGKKLIPSLVWQRLIKRCGQEGGYLAQWRHETNKNDKPVVIWFGVTGNQEELTYEALKERLRRRKAR